MKKMDHIIIDDINITENHIKTLWDALQVQKKSLNETYLKYVDRVIRMDVRMGHPPPRKEFLEEYKKL